MSASLHDRLEIGPARDDRELQAFAELVHVALGFPRLEEMDWLALEHHAGIRLARLDGEVVGTLELVPMAQWLDGQAVPMGGVRCVTAAPHVRGRGVASALLRAALDECAERRWPISTLYPSTQPVYRRAGYETAGLRVIWELPTAALGDRRRPDGIAIRPLEKARDAEWVQALHLQQAAVRSGNLDRGEWGWRRLWDRPAKLAFRGYAIEESGTPTGYCFVDHEESDDIHQYDVRLHDFEVGTPGALDGLLWFCAQQRSMGQRLRWHGGLADPIVAALPAQRASVFWRGHWMTRVVDLPAALLARGWPAGVTVDVAFRVHDDRRPDNAGPWRLQLADGQALLERAPRAELELDVRALGPLLTGFRGPIALRDAGLCTGSDDALTRLGAAFAGPLPVLRTMF